MKTSQSTKNNFGFPLKYKNIPGYVINHTKAKQHFKNRKKRHNFSFHSFSVAENQEEHFTPCSQFKKVSEFQKKKKKLKKKTIQKDTTINFKPEKL